MVYQTHEFTANQLTVLRSLTTLLQEPVNFPAIYNLDAVLRQTHLSTIAIDYLKTQPGIAEIMQERYLAPAPDLDALLRYPQESLGYAFATHLKANGLDPMFYRQSDVHDDITYIALRRSQTHDIYHLITGFGTDLVGEIGLQAFTLAQIRSPLAIPLMASGIVAMLPSPEQLDQTMTCIYQGWQMGTKAKPFMAQKWEEHWEKSIAEWRTELEVDPVS